MDSSECRDSFRHVEKWYADDRDYYVEVDNKMNGYYSDILDKMSLYDVNLVDNQEYITWATTEANSELYAERGLEVEVQAEG